MPGKSTYATSRISLPKGCRSSIITWEGAEVFELLPKNLDIFANDLPERVTTLGTAGATFRTDTYSDVTTPRGKDSATPTGHNDIMFFQRGLDNTREFVKPKTN